MKLEACIESLAEAMTAAKFKLDRAELCSALELGGLTPSFALTKACAEHIEIHAMVRPRGGSFVYTQEEVDLMMNEIEALANAGVVGVVFGCLTETNTIDLEANQQLLKKTKSLGLVATFHRAFDFLFDMKPGVGQLIEMGFDRVLTSGGQANAANGLNQIMQLITQASGRIEIMAGSGINAQNIKAIKASGVDAAHFSIRKKQVGISRLNMGEHYLVSPKKIESILKALT